MNLILLIICCSLLFGADATRRGLGCLVKLVLMGLVLLLLIAVSVGMNAGMS